MKKLYDVSMSLESGMVTWPGNSPFSLEAVNRISEGASSNVSLLHLGTHCGTHIDAPCHFIDGAPGVDCINPEILIGQARLFQLPDIDQIDREVVGKINLEGIKRVIFGTRNSALLDQPHATDYVSVTEDAAQYLVDRKIILVGIDYLSIEAYKPADYRTHKTFLNAGIVIVEGLDLHEVPEGEYEILCLPLKIKNADGAPARVTLREL